jgi:hypothetical protein
VASATISVTKRNIEARKAKVVGLRSAAKKLSERSPQRAIIRAQIKVLLTEIAALKASLHYYKPTDRLSGDITSQRKKVRALTAAFEKAKGRKQFQIGKQLRREAKELNEMLAAAKLQQIKTGVKSPLPLREERVHLSLVRPNPVGSESSLGREAPEVQDEDAGPTYATPEQALATEEADSTPSGFQPSEFSLEAVPEMASTALAKLDESWEKLDDYTDEDGEVWYKNPIVIVGAGVAAYLILRRS